ncbi:MAG: DinB family protein [Planctomycetota bacterium]
MTMPEAARELVGPPIDRGLLADIPWPSLLHRYRSGIELFDPRVIQMTDEQLDTAFLSDAGVGRWPVRVLLGHLADGDLGSVHRMRRIAAEDNPVLSAWDEDAFVDSGIYGSTEASSAWPKPCFPVGAYAAVIYTLREWASAWLGGLDESLLARRGLHPQHGEVSLRGIVEFDTWHLEHHVRFLNAKAFKLLGPAPEPERCDDVPSGGCGPGCGCAPGASGDARGGADG